MTPTPRREPTMTPNTPSNLSPIVTTRTNHEGI